ncbi:unnamed protein product [Allacma fusca]|uniref:Uncharacterized protein n=1 Tax=Allacma fusca TaxID=39272 RepID=A0A8J2K9W5_9HEXA|nr:unnamed protein product [Allacma fusca]
MVSLRSVPVILQLAFVTGLLTEDTSSSGSARQEFVCCHEGLRGDGLSTLRFEDAIVDAAGKKCYQPIPKPSFNALFIKGSLDEAFATAFAEVCPELQHAKFFKDEVEDDHLGDSLNVNTTREVECVERITYITDLYAVPLPDMAPLFFECSIRPVKNHAQGHITTDLISIDRWARFKKEWISSHSAIWNQFNASKSVDLNVD